ncbi:MAG: 3'(2'),5'-bisphosphate nucleotidase CysQ [Cyclobacteriaceae bacterium]
MKLDHKSLIDIAVKAGEGILSIYHDKAAFAEVAHKKDNSPLTKADSLAHEIIADGLDKLYPEIPVLSEEGRDIAYHERKLWKKFWLVDPLDGTKEFLNRNNEFTVNIALIDGAFPVFGIIYAPVFDTIYIGDLISKTAYKIEQGQTSDLNVSGKTQDIRAVRSRSHATQEEDGLLSTFDVQGSVSAGSSLKFCLVANGLAEIYYRHGPTMEWDTAAGQAILEAAGGSVVHGITRERFSYNKENLLNPSFLCKGF